MSDLFLFDVDGTLIDANETHLDAFDKAFQAVFNVYVPRETVFSCFGTPGPAFVETVCKKAGIAFVPEQLAQVRTVWESEMLDTLRREDIIILAGVEDFLKKLKADGIPCGVITGNNLTIGQKLLEVSGLQDYFSIESYSSSTTVDRIELIQKAVAAHGEVDRVCVVGDTVFDIKAGKDYGAFTVGVPTGPVSEETLLAAEPDIVVSSLEKYEDILEKFHAFSA